MQKVGVFEDEDMETGTRYYSAPDDPASSCDPGVVTGLAGTDQTRVYSIFLALMTEVVATGSEGRPIDN